MAYDNGTGIGIGTTSAAYQFAIHNAADVWHVQIGSVGGNQLRIGGNTTNGAVIGAYTDNTTTTPRSLLLQRDGGPVGINTASPDTLYNLTTVRYAGSSGNIKLIGDTSVTGSPNILFYNTATSASSTLSWNGTGFTMGSYVSANAATLYSPLNVQGASVSWGESMTIYAAPNGYSTVAFRTEAGTGSTTTGTWAIGKESSTAGNTATQFFQVIKNGLTGSTLHRADALQTWDPSGNSYFGFRVGIGTSSPQDKLDVNGSIRFRANTPNFTAVLDNAVIDYVPTSVFAGDPCIRIASIGTASVGADIRFLTGTSTSLSEKMRISSGGTTTFYGGNVVNSASYKAHTYVQLTTPISYSTSVTGNTFTSFSTTGIGLPSGVKAIQVLGWYHITGYGSGAGQGDHAVSLFGVTTDSATSWGGPSAGWPGGNSSFVNTNWGSFVLWHDGDASNSGNTNGIQYYGYMDSGVISVNANGNVYANLAHGYSGGTHYISLQVQGYWI
jgi:hypothetical protein